MKLTWGAYTIEIKDVSNDFKVRFDIKWEINAKSGKTKLFESAHLYASGGGIEEFPSPKKAKRWLFKFLSSEVKSHERLKKVPKGRVEELIKNSDLKAYL